MPPGEPPVRKGKIMDYLLDIVRTLLLSVAALVVCFLLALAGFFLIYGGKGEKSVPCRPAAAGNCSRSLFARSSRVCLPSSCCGGR